MSIVYTCLYIDLYSLYMSLQRSESVWLILVLLAEETVHFSKEYRWHHCIYTAALVDRAMTTRITEHSGLKRPNSDLIKSFYVMSFWSSFLFRSRRWNLCAYRAHPTFELDSAAWRRNPSSREETYWQRPLVHHVVRQHASILYNLQPVSCPLLNMFELASMPFCCETRSSPVQQEHRGLPHHLRMVMFWSQSIKRGVFLAPPSVFLGNLDFFRPFSTFLDISGHSSTGFSLGNIKHAPVPQVVTGPCLAKRPQSDSQDPNMACCGQRMQKYF